jgi:hypothetical protein
MRYYKAEEHTFEAADGRRINLKDPLPIAPKSSQSIPVKTDSGVMLDEIASRPNVYGEGMEAEAYKIFDENITELFESRFNMETIAALRIPL